jgi:hypothetical protein
MTQDYAGEMDKRVELAPDKKVSRGTTFLHWVAEETVQFYKK